jgi:hypothetical protein
MVLGVALVLATTIVTAQLVNALIPSNANFVGRAVNNNGFDSNHSYMQSCKQFRSAQACATATSGNGPVTSNLAHRFNGP